MAYDHITNTNTNKMSDASEVHGKLIHGVQASAAGH
jgi:hypothetical protein